jgi:hypothetical protein
LIGPKVHHAFGYVYFWQFKAEEALASHQAALDLYKQLGSPQGQITTLGYIILIYVF